MSSVTGGEGGGCGSRRSRRRWCSISWPNTNSGFHGPTEWPPPLRAAAEQRGKSMTLPPGEGVLQLPGQRLEYRLIDGAAPVVVLLHEGLGSVSAWGRFPDQLAAATGSAVFVYSRAGYGR